MNKLSTLFSLLLLSSTIRAEPSDTISTTNTTLCNCDMEQYDHIITGILILSIVSLALSSWSMYFIGKATEGHGYNMITN